MYGSNAIIRQNPSGKSERKNERKAIKKQVEQKEVREAKVN